MLITFPNEKKCYNSTFLLFIFETIFFWFYWKNMLFFGLFFIFIDLYLFLLSFMFVIFKHFLTLFIWHNPARMILSISNWVRLAPPGGRSGELVPRSLAENEAALYRQWLPLAAQEPAPAGAAHTAHPLPAGGANPEQPWRYFGPPRLLPEIAQNRGSTPDIMEDILSTPPSRSENRRIQIGPNPTDWGCSQRDIRGGSHQINYVDFSLMTKWIIDDQDDERPPTLRYILKQLHSKGEGSTYYKSMLQAWMKRNYP